MSEVRKTNDNTINGFRVPSELRFMFEKISVSEIPMAYWLTIPEFVSAIRRMIHDGVTIDDVSVLPLMRSIYDEKAKNKERQDFFFGTARRAIHQLDRNTSANNIVSKSGFAASK